MSKIYPLFPSLRQFKLGFLTPEKPVSLMLHTPRSLFYKWDNGELVQGIIIQGHTERQL